ncbi:MAG: hypothetical protein ACRD6W_17745, partial [Nitrososphaerales archaeon]
MSKLETYVLPTVIMTKGTIRYRIRISLGGSKLRVVFSNEYGRSALRIAAVTVAMAADGLN